MARSDGVGENQHYVPKLLLRNFARSDSNGASEQVHVFDKWKSKRFISNVRNIAAAFDFYEAEEAGVSLEKPLSELESQAAQALRKMIDAERVGDLTASERQWIAIFCATQFSRTQSVREQVRRMNEGIAARIQKMGHDLSAVDGFRVMSEADIKMLSLRLLVDALRNDPPRFMRKIWFLIKAPPGEAFFIGDHPITLHNDIRAGSYGNLGLEVLGIQIYLPLTPSLTLAMWDDATLAKLFTEIAPARSTFAKLQKHLAREPKNLELKQTIDEMSRLLAPSEELFEAAKNGGSLQADAEFVTLLNSLQVKHATRFLMSADENFTLVEFMIRNNPAFRTTDGDGLQIG